MIGLQKINQTGCLQRGKPSFRSFLVYTDIASNVGIVKQLACAGGNDSDEVVERFFAANLDNFFDVALNVSLNIRAVK